MRQLDGEIADRGPAGSLFNSEMWTLRVSERDAAVAAQHFDPAGRSTRAVIEMGVGSMRSSNAVDTIHDNPGRMPV